MLRRALFASLTMSLASLPAASLAYDIKPRNSDSAFTAKTRPDILGISTDATADSARTIFEAVFKGRSDTKTDIQQQKFGGTAVSYIAALTFSFPSGPKQTGEVLSSSFSSPASANRAYFVARNLTFAPDQQPSKTEMIKQVMDKYGAPTIVGDQHLYYIYRAGKIVSVGTKYKETTALDAIDRPLDPRAAIKLNGANGRGSCVAVVKRSQAKEKSLSAMLDEAKAPIATARSACSSRRASRRTGSAMRNSRCWISSASSARPRSTATRLSRKRTSEVGPPTPPPPPENPGAAGATPKLSARQPSRQRTPPCSVYVPPPDRQSA